MKRIIPFRALSIAASIAITLGLGAYFLLINYNPDNDSNIVAQQEEIDDAKRDFKQDLKSKNKGSFNEDEETLGVSEESEMFIQNENQVLEIPVIEKVEIIEEQSVAEAQDEELEQIEVIEYSVPLFEKDNAASGVMVEMSDSNEQDKEFLEEEVSSKKSESEVSDQDKNVKVKAKSQSKGISESQSESVSEEEITKLAEPEGGSLAFQNYLNKNLKVPVEAKKNDVKGNVEISFKVDKKGKLSNFKIEEGLGSGCDEEAIRLIKEGPKWIPSHQVGKPRNDRATVIVEF